MENIIVTTPTQIKQIIKDALREYDIELKKAQEKNKIETYITKAEFVETIECGYKRLYNRIKSGACKLNENGKIPFSYLQYCKINPKW